MQKNTRVDWFRVLADLKRAGLSMYMVADRLGVPRTTLRQYQDGTSPKHHTGASLVSLWAEVTGRSRESLPMDAPALSAAKIR